MDSSSSPTDSFIDEKPMITGKFLDRTFLWLFTPTPRQSDSAIRDCLFIIIPFDIFYWAGSYHVYLQAHHHFCIYAGQDKAPKVR